MFFNDHKLIHHYVCVITYILVKFVKIDENAKIQPVDDSFVLCQPENSFLRISGLRQRRHRPDLDEAEANLRQAGNRLRIL